MPSTITSLEVVVDDVEYSRYEPTRKTVTATVVALGSTFASEPVRVDFVKARRGRDAIVGTATITFTGASPQSHDVQFDLTSLVDQDLFNLVRHGQYFIRATALNDITIIGESADFHVSIMTVEKFRADYLFGIPLIGTQIFGVKYQPQSITGVEIIEVSPDTPTGFGTLSYIYQASPLLRTLSWMGGPPVSITAPGTYILRAGTSSSGGCSGGLLGAYIVVKIKSLSLLPTTSITEDILIENKTITDDTLRGYIDKEISYLEEVYLATFLEPTTISTDENTTTVQYSYASASYAPLYSNTDWDYIWAPLSYNRKGSSGNWLYLNFPHPQILRIDSMYGAIAGTRIIDIDLDWIQPSKQGGMVQIVPYNQEVAFNYLGLTINGNYGQAETIPNFWHYFGVFGLRECPPDLMMFIGKLAAVDALTALGAAFRPGYTSVSNSRDGVSSSTSFANTMKYGIYTGAITAAKEWIDKEGPRFRAKYRGAIAMVC